MKLLNKKGMTLVELIVTSIITVIIIGAAVPCLFLAIDTARAGNANLQQYQNANLAENYLHSAIETAKSYSFISQQTGAQAPTTDYAFYFDTDSSDKNSEALFVKLNGKLLVKIYGVESIEFTNSTIKSTGTKKDYISYKITSVYEGEKMLVEGAAVLLNSKGDIGDIKETLSHDDKASKILHIKYK